MTASTERAQFTRTADSGEGFAVLAARILEIRSAFLDQLNLLPVPFNEVIKDHYIARMVRAEDRYMLGEYAPFFIADIFQFPDSLTHNLAIPWLVLYEHSLLVDDIVDVQEQIWPQQLLASQLFFDEVLSLWRDRFAKYPDLWQSFCKYHEEGISAAFQELVPGKDLPGPSLRSLDAHIIMGRKAALVKFCAATLSMEDRGRLLSSKEEAAIDKLCAGVQLLDDLSDCLEDYGNHRYTYPLRIAFERLGLSCRNRAETSALLDDDFILFVVMVSGAATHVAKLARHYFEDGRATLDVRSTSTTGSYIQSLIENCSQFTEAFELLRSERADVIKATLAALSDQNRISTAPLSNPAYERFWVEMRNCFKIIAVAAN